MSLLSRITLKTNGITKHLPLLQTAYSCAFFVNVVE